MVKSCSDLIVCLRRASISAIIGFVLLIFITIGFGGFYDCPSENNANELFFPTRFTEKCSDSDTTSQNNNEEKSTSVFVKVSKILLLTISMAFLSLGQTMYEIFLPVF